MLHRLRYLRLRYLRLSYLRWSYLRLQCLRVQGDGRRLTRPQFQGFQPRPEFPEL